MPDDISFEWPATGSMQVFSLPGGGCNIKFTFAERGIVRAIAKGRVLKVRNIPTKRIAQQFEILVRHEGDFESSYSIVDQTPAGEAGHRISPGTVVECGCELYDIRNGGFLHFQLSCAGRFVDPRQYIGAELGNLTDAPHRGSET